MNTAEQRRARLLVPSLHKATCHSPLTLSSDDFMRFFINKIVSIREKIDGILPTIITDVSSSAEALEVSLEPDLYLDGFCPVDLSTAIIQLNSVYLYSAKLQQLSSQGT